MQIFQLQRYNFYISTCFDALPAMQGTIYILLQETQKILHFFNYNKSIKTIRT